MKFFLPLNVEGAEEAENNLECIARFANATIPEPRIFRLEYKHNGREMVAEVGKPIDPYYEEGNQIVIAILLSGAGYAVCLPLRGVGRGEPIMVGHDSVIRIEYFDK